MAHPSENAVLVAPYCSWMDGTVVELGNDDSIHRFIAKEDFRYKDSEKYYKTENIYKFSKSFICQCYIPFLGAYIESEGVQQYYEQVLSVINFFNRQDLKACILPYNALWNEIDDKQDLSNAEVLFADETKLSLMQNRYGGYWRFPRLLDFCYLVNPYFPDKRMIKEMKHSFETLLREYPSGLNTQNLLSSRMFAVKEDYILTGNGAAELISALMESFQGKKTGFILPTFNEYAERVAEGDRVFFSVENKDFSYGKKEILKWSKDVDALVLINPDNPSGNFICVEDLIEIIVDFQKRGKILVLDESFVDFSTEGASNTLLKNSLLKEYPNLMVMKSISKSYGVPGLRLGILASSNTELITECRKYLSIWNINSFAEFFLQIYSKYEESCLTSCGKIAKERFVSIKNSRKSLVCIPT